MLDSLRELLERMVSPEGGSIDAGRSADEVRALSAVLLVHVAAIDGQMLDVEHKQIKHLLKERFSLDETDAERLIADCALRERGDFDLYAVTSQLKRQLTPAQRRQIVAMMWDTAESDQSLHEFEEGVVWRIAELLGVPEAARLTARPAEE